MNSNMWLIAAAICIIGIVFTRHSKGSFLFTLFIAFLVVFSGLWALSEKESVVKACTIAAKKAS